MVVYLVVVSLGFLWGIWWWRDLHKSVDTIIRHCDDAEAKLKSCAENIDRLIAHRSGREK